MSAEKLEEAEIHAYIDGELDLAGRMAVEGHLARNPALAARVMADMRTCSALRLLTGTEPKPSCRLDSTIAQLRSRSVPVWRRSAMAATALTGILALAGLQLEKISSPPAYVGVAVASHRSLMGQPANVVPAADSTHRQAILSASRIAVPRLPPNWRVTDVKLLTSKARPATLIAVRTDEGRDLSLFAIRERSSAPREPDTVRAGLESVAYWSAGDISYALTGEGDPGPLDATADALAASWRT